MKRLAGVDDEGKLKPAVQFVLPLLGQAPGAHHQTAFEVTPDDHLLHEKTRHDGLAAAWIVGEKEAEGLARQHRLVDRRDLVGERLDQRRMDRQQGIEEVGEADALGLGDKAEERTVGVEGPRTGLGDCFEAILIAPVQDLGG